MSLFYNPNQSGKGVAKKEPEKRPFFKFWDIFGRKFWKLIQLNLIYILFCIPIITVGPATAALTQVMRKFVLEHSIFVFDEFFSAFKRNFKQSLFVGILDVTFIFFFILTLYEYAKRVIAEPIIDNYMLVAATMFSGIIFLTLNLYVYPQIVSLKLKLPAIFKNAALLGIAGLKRGAVTVICYIGIISLFYLFFPFSFLILPIAPFSFLALISVFNAYPVIQQYIIDPYYKSIGEKNPEADESDDLNEAGELEKPEEKSLFTDLGGKEQAINKKKLKTGGKTIK